MKKNITTSFNSIVLIILISLSCNSKHQDNYHLKKSIPTRIISLAPSITETLFALGLGKNVVGVTNYCTYPSATDSIEKIGGYSTPNLEKIFTLNPDLVILQKEHEKALNFVKEQNIPYCVVNYSNAKNICNSFKIIGKACGVPNKSDSLIKILKPALIPEYKDTSNLPSVLICIGREGPGKGVQSVYVAGAGSYYNDLLLSAGGKNAFKDSLPKYPKLSKEGILMTNPDIIIDIATFMSNAPCSTLVNDWNTIPTISAVKNHHVYCVFGAYATIPGPRLILFFNDIKRIISEYYN